MISACLERESRALGLVGRMKITVVFRVQAAGQ